MTVQIDRAPARREAVAELLDPAYEREGWWDRLLRWLADAWAGLAEALGGRGGGLATVVMVLVLLGLAVALLWLLRGATGDRSAPAPVLLGEQQRTAAEHRAEADRLAAQRRWGAAIQERLRAVSRELEQQGAVTALPGRTADELAAAAGEAMPEVADDLRRAARLFDEVAYGGRPGSAEDYAVLVGVDDQVSRSGAGAGR